MFTAPPSQNLRSCFEPVSFKPFDPMHQLTPSLSKTEQSYVHPLIKPHSLSPKSLEMCTESLGNETGNDIISDSDAFSRRAFEGQSPRGVYTNPAKKQEVIKKTKRVCSFPPPLTSISGSEGVRVQSHREGGRLVIKAFRFSRCRNYFRAERGNGRLRLTLFRDNEDESIDNEQCEEEEEEEERVDNDKAEEGKRVIYGDESEEDGDFRGRCYWGEDATREDGGRMGCKINGGDWSAVGRCNGDRSGGSKSRLTSLPFCVAT